MWIFLVKKVKISKKKINTLPFTPANCAFDIEWPEVFIQKNEGLPLKNITISCDGFTQKGEVVLTEFGIEGNAIYGLTPQIQKQLSNGRKAKIEIAVAKGKKQYDKRETKKKSDWQRDKARIFRKTS